MLFLAAILSACTSMEGTWAGACTFTEGTLANMYWPATLAVDGEVDGALETWLELQTEGDNEARMSGAGGGIRDGQSYDIVAPLEFRAGPGGRAAPELRSVASLDGADFSPGSSLQPTLELDFVQDGVATDSRGTCTLQPE